MKLEEKEVSSTRIFDGRVVHLCCDEVMLPNGQTSTREYVKHVGAVCIVAVTDEGEVLLERQFRYPFRRVLTEIPAGKLNSKDEPPREAALRELREETGAVPREFYSLGPYYGSPAILDECIHMFLAKGLVFEEQSPDEDEFLEVFKVPLKEAARMVLSGELEDGKTQAAILRAAALLGQMPEVDLL